MSGLKKLHELCTKDGRDFPSRLEVQTEMERLLAEEGPSQEFLLRPLFFKSQEDFRLHVQSIWDAGYETIVVVRKGEKYGR